MITHKSTGGLGAGSTIAYLVEALKKPIEDGIELAFVTSSFSTLQLLQNHQLPVRTAASLKEIDIYFDDCDQLNMQLNALKSGAAFIPRKNYWLLRQSNL